MSKIIDIRVSPAGVANTEVWTKIVARQLKIERRTIGALQLLKRSIDARGRSPKYQLRIKVYFEGEAIDSPMSEYAFPAIGKNYKQIVIVGAGPCGYYAALRCIELGLCPVVVDRGKDVQARRKDLRQIQQFNIVNPNSNYCFGEGGAGTYSDGKLYTRSNKRGNIRKMLEILVQHGAKSDILIDAHPHIGSNKLPQIISAIRQTIEDAGGKVLFDTQVTDFIISLDTIKGVIDQKGHEIIGAAVVLCTGHSARDIYELCQRRAIKIAFKPFALGMRLEHPQALIDQIQYNRPKGKDLPAASYALSCQVDDHGVFSFCMCPGGMIVPTATSPGEIVVNGMSLSKRDSPYANAATVVTIDENPEPNNPLGGMNYQSSIEQSFFNHGDGSQAAPAQRMTDFIKGRVSDTLLDTSYIPGVYSAPLHELLPRGIVDKIRQAIKVFDHRMRGYLTEDAQFVGLESRTSAPVRIPRDKSTLMHVEIKGLFPAGEGAGYAGGILSAALDGERIADAVNDYLKS